MSNIEALLENDSKTQSLIGLTSSQVRKRLPAERFALIIPNKRIPTGWPAEVVQIKEDSQTKRKTCIWFTSNGKEWRDFYSYGLSTYINDHKLIPAYIYERKNIAGKLHYVPVVSLLLSLKRPAKLTQVHFLHYERANWRLLALSRWTECAHGGLSLRLLRRRRCAC